MSACPICSNERGRFKRCYQCQPRGPRKHKTGEIRACLICGRERYWQKNQLENGEGEYCSNKCKYIGKRGKTPKGRTGIGHTFIRKDGYVAIKVGVGRGVGYELAHRVVVETHLGRKLRSDEQVHHLDGNRQNNSIENLQVLTNVEHQRLHNHPITQRKRISVPCAWTGCDQIKEVVASRLKTYKNVYCSHEHRLAAMHQKAREYHAMNRATRGYHQEWPQERYVPYGPNWAEQSRQCLSRDANQCQHCGSRKDLQVAHIIARGQFALDQYEEANALENLITLCRSCHLRFDFVQGVR